MYKKLKQIQIQDRFVSALKSEAETSYVGKSDNFFFQRMCDLIFQSGVRGMIWERYEPAIRKEFKEYDVKKVVKFSDKDVDRIIKNKKMFKHRKKIEACIHNAKEIVKLSEEYGGFSTFIFQYKGQVPILIEELVKRMKWMSYTNAYAFLRYVGVQVMKTDVNVRRVLSRLGLIDSELINQKTLKQIQEVGEAMAKAVGERVATIDYTIYMYGAGERGFVKYSVCGVAPICDECELKEFCRYARENP